MGRSLRRAKRYRTKVRVGVEKKRKNVKAPEPIELTLESGAAALAVKLPKLAAAAAAATAAGGKGGEEGEEGPTAIWNPARPLTKNYAAAGVAADANARYGRNHRPSVLRVDDAEEGERRRGREAATTSSADDDGGDSTDDDLRAVSGLPRKHSARAPPPKLTSTQEIVISALREAHGTDVEAMVKDIKLNRMLLPASKLKKMIEADDFWGRRPGKPSLEQLGVEAKGRGRCGFRMPRKSL